MQPNRGEYTPKKGVSLKTQNNGKKIEEKINNAKW